MSLVPDMFEYEGPLDLTEYYVTNTELNAETGDLIRVKVITINGSTDQMALKTNNFCFSYRL